MKPRVYNGSGTYQSNAMPLASDLFTGQRWRSELGLYDDRNRFMSPDLGRFIQPDPIGFKGDASNLYRYCGNDWANKTDPMGTEGTPRSLDESTSLAGHEKEDQNRDWQAPGMGLWKFEKAMEVSFELSPISGNQNIHEDRIRNESGKIEPNAIARTDASLDIHAVSTGANSVTIVAETKIDVHYADKVKPAAREFQKKEPDHYNEIKQKFYDVAATRVKALNEHAKAFKSGAEGLRTMESQLRKLFNDALDYTRKAHDNYDGVHNKCDHCYQDPNPFLP